MNSTEWLTRLIAFDTTSRCSNLDLVHAVCNWLDIYHCTTRLTYDETGKKANVFAMLPAQNGAHDGGIILSGHTDVVPVDGQQWDSDPFQATVQHGNIIGRGACDMKGFLAVILSLLPQWSQSSLKKPVYFAFSYDEEVGCLGVPKLIADLQAEGIRPAACIVGEPTLMQPVVAHKGIQAFRCRVHGQAAHSSLTHRGCNAIEYAAELVCALRRFSMALKQQDCDPDFDVPFTSLTNNLIAGGSALNIIPSLCEVTFEFRHLPQVKPADIIAFIQNYIEQDLLPAMRKEYPDAKIELQPLGSVPAFQAVEQAAITQHTHRLAGSVQNRKVSYATEAGLFQQAGIPTVLCGPGSIEQAHRANEFVAIDQLRQCEQFLSNLVQQF